MTPNQAPQPERWDAERLAEEHLGKETFLRLRAAPDLVAKDAFLSGAQARAEWERKVVEQVREKLEELIRHEEDEWGMDMIARECLALLEKMGGERGK